MHRTVRPIDLSLYCEIFQGGSAATGKPSVGPSRLAIQIFLAFPIPTGGSMTGRAACAIGVMLLWPLLTTGDARTQEKPQVQIPNPGIPEVMTMEAKFVRAAYNNEGYVILGYQVNNRSIGEEWMLLEVGLTVLDRTPDYT